jgi:hypothetical protein
MPLKHEHEHCRPLCPSHPEQLMVLTPHGAQATGRTHNTVERLSYECSLLGCRQNYAPDLGYFTMEENDDYWNGSRSPSLRISRRSTQVICGQQHRYVMYIESFDANGRLANFRCPLESCQQTVQIPADGPPAYWLGEGFFNLTQV